MKKWLKSLFKGDSLNEMKDEIDEKPSDARVLQSHSIDIKKQDEVERPNFRFPLQLDDDVIIKEEQDHDVDAVFQKQKNYDFWQNNSSQSTNYNQINRENQTSFKQRDDFWHSSSNVVSQTNREKIQPSFNQRDDFWQDSTNSKNQLHREEVQSVYKQQKHNFTRSEETHQTEKAVPEKEEKVDIVFRPKRKTPFRPSEYISPIYGYQKPDNSVNEVQSDQLLKREVGAIEEVQSQPEVMTVEVNQIEQNQTAHNYHQNQQDSIESEVNSTPSILFDEKQSEELLNDITQDNLPHHDYENNELKEIEIIEEKSGQEDHHSEAMQHEIHNNVEVVTDMKQTPDPVVPLIEEEIEEPKVTEVIDTIDSTNLVTDYYELKDEESSIQERETKEFNESYDKEPVSNEQYNTEDEAVEVLKEIIKNGYVTQEEDIILKEQVSDCEDEVHNGTTESMIQIDNSEEMGNLVVNKQLDSAEEEIVTTSNQLQNEQETIVEQSEPSIEEASQVSQVAPEKNNEEKREKKRNFPFNVMMLRSDVEASRKANIMRQLRELQSEAAATLEKVDEETEVPGQKAQNESKSLESEIVKEQQSVENHVNESPSVKQIDTIHEITQTKDDMVESLQYESVHEEIIENALEKQIDEVIVETVDSIETTPNQDQEEPVMPPVLYELPELDLLTEPPVEQFNDGDWVESQKELLQETLQNFNVGAKVIAATQGPTVTRFEVQPEPGVKVNKITNLQDDIKLSLAARDIRIEAPIPGRSAIGIEVPNRESKPVYLRELVSEDKFLQSESPLTVALGLDIGGEPVFADISKMPHGLIAGATGSGKSVCINSILVSILYKAKPHEVKLILIDPKMVELAPYNHIPHLISPVITDARAATAALKWACDEMDRRYDLFAHAGARDIKRFNDLAKKKGAYNDELPYLVIVIDELADLMMVSPGDVETYICRIAQKARACGIHLLVATQRPSVDVITGIIKSNIPTRIAFTVSSQVDSRTIIDIGGAEKLLGRGDMLFLDNGKSQAIRLQGVYVSDDEIEHVVEIVKDQQKPNYLFNQEELVAKADAHEVDDELFEEAVEFVIDQKGASVSMLQRRFRIGYNRAARLVDLMFDHGIVSNQNGSKPRDVLMTLEQFHSEE